MVKENSLRVKVAVDDMEGLLFAAEQIVSFAKEQNVNLWLFNAEMGAGKTTLIKNICDVLGVIDSVSSPTFSIVNTYKTNKEEEIYHFDFYRLKNKYEALDIGVEEYLDSEKLCLMEWPEIIEEFIDDEYIQVAIKVANNGSREIEAIKHG